MSHKRLSDPELKEFKKLALEGYTPKDLSDHFKIGVSSVHNYKVRLTEREGIEFPNVRGERPKGGIEARAAGGRNEGSGTFEAPKSGHKSRPSTQKIPPNNLPKENSDTLGVIDTDDREHISRFIINGTSVVVKGAKKVIIGKESMEIIY